MHYLCKNINSQAKSTANNCSPVKNQFLNFTTLLQSLLFITASIVAITILLFCFATTSMAAQQNNSRSTIISNSSNGAGSGNGGTMFSNNSLRNSNGLATTVATGRGIGLPCNKAADPTDPDYLDPYACFNDTTTFGQGVTAGSSNDLIYQCQGNSKSSGFTSLGAGFTTNNFTDRDCSAGSSNNLDPFSSVSALSLTQIASALASTQTSLNMPSPTTVTGLDSGLEPASAISETFNGGEDRIYLSPMFQNLESSLADNNSDCASMAAWSDSAKKRCNNIDEAFSYKMETDGITDTTGTFNRLFHASFSINSLTDENGDLVGTIEGSYDMHYQQLSGVDVQDDACSGTFTVTKEVDGFWYYNGLKIDAANSTFWEGDVGKEGAVDPCNGGSAGWTP